MDTTGSSTGEPPAGALARSWQAAAVIGAVTLILGIIVTVHPTGSLNVLAILIGVILLLEGIFHLIRVFDADEPHRVWLGIAGLLFIVAGVILIRHLSLTLAIIGLFVGISWIVQGVVVLVVGLAGGSRAGRGWWIAFGLISLIAGIVVATAPVSSLTTLAVLLGIWFIIMGLFEIAGALILRHGLHRASASTAHPKPA